MHIHQIGKRLQGPKVADDLRCVSCGCSTKTRKYKKCEKSDNPGGHICTKCIKKHPERELDCNLWVPYDRKAYCQRCTAHKNDLIPCFACQLECCSDCMEPITMAFWLATGSLYVLCSECCKTELFLCPETGESQRSDGHDEYFCPLCQEWHMGERPVKAIDACENCDLPWDTPTLARIFRTNFVVLREKDALRICFLDAKRIF